jgi:hypothetical protein
MNQDIQQEGKEVLAEALRKAIKHIKRVAYLHDHTDADVAIIVEPFETALQAYHNSKLSQKEHLKDIIKSDEELGLYDDSKLADSPKEQGEIEDYTHFVKIAEAAIKGDSDKAKIWVHSFIEKFPDSKFAKPLYKLLTGQPNSLHLLSEPPHPLQYREQEKKLKLKINEN